MAETEKQKQPEQDAYTLKSSQKARFWWGVLYPENMRPAWREEIDDLLQVPFSYCVHDKCVDESGDERKVHVHLIIVFPNTTTYNHALSVFDSLSADGKRAINKCEPVKNIRHAYDYIIHATESCKKKHKHPYPPEERICGNNFDIGSYEQLSAADKERMCDELADMIMKYGFTDFTTFFMVVCSEMDDEYRGIARNYSGFLERLTRGNYQRAERERFARERNDAMEREKGE